MHTYRQIIYLELIQICFQCHSLICLDFSMNNLIISKIEKKLSYPYLCSDGGAHYVDIDQGIYKVKLKVALNEKRKKLHGFSFSINIANFEAFL